MRQSQRAFGAPSNHNYEYIKSDALNTDFKIPSESDYKIQTGTPIWNDRMLAWVNSKFPVERLTDRLMNDNSNPYSAYHWFGKSALL